MVSGAVPVSASSNLGHRSHGHLAPGQLCTGVISIQRALYNLVLSTANNRNIKLSTLPPAWEPLAATNLRPCIFLQWTLQGIHVLALSTFQGHEPETWNTFLRQIVVPIGDSSTIRPIFHDRRAFQTEPAWTHHAGHPTYIFPEIVVLPLGTPLRRLPVAMSHSMARELKNHCIAVLRTVQTSPLVSVQSWIRSFEDNPYGRKTWATLTPVTPEEHNIADTRDGVSESSVHPLATKSVPRAVFEAAMSSPGLENSSNCASTIAFGITPPPSVRPLSIHQVLQDNTSLLSGQCENVKSLQLRARREDDKENVGL